jgi:carbonic anhydrase
VFFSNDGYKLRLIGDQLGFGVLEWEGKVWVATEVHFHHPSEHALGDQQMKMDMEV